MKVKMMHKTKKRKPVLCITILIFLLLGIIIYIRPDIRFCITNTWNQIIEKPDFHEFQINEDHLDSILVKNIKHNKTDIVYNHSLVLINNKYPFSSNMVPDLVNYKNTTVQMDKSLVNAYTALSKVIKNQLKDNLYVMDSYRSNEEQKKLYDKDKQTAAMPGSSEHQAGLALDVYVRNFAGNGFLKSKPGQFVNKNCWKYGFIIRYPIFKKNVTGIRFEPWHIRYVGLPHSEIIYKNSMCLEEYIQSLKIGIFYKSNKYIISRQSGEKLLIPDNLTEIVVSPDNMGNYIITGKQQ